MNSADELISRHVDGANTAAETEELGTLVASDPHTARALVRAARLEVMLPRRLPRQPSRAPLRWTLAAAAAALVAGSVLAARMLTTPDAPVTAVADQEENWLPVEKIARLPIREINPAARAQWEFWHDAREEAHVPLPELKLSWERKDEVLRVNSEPVEQRADWGPKRREARIVEMQPDGLIDLGDGDKVKLRSFAIKVPDFAAYHPQANPIPLKPLIFTGLSGEMLTGDAASYIRSEGSTRFLGNSSRLWVNLERLSGKEITILGMDIFQPETRMLLSGTDGTSSLAGDELRAGREVLLTSRAPVMVALELGVPKSAPIVLPFKEGAAGSEGFSEVRLAAIQPGAWRIIAGGIQGHPKQFMTAAFRQGEDKEAPERHCLVGLNISPGLSAKITARTASGVFSFADYLQIYRNQQFMLQFASFDVPASSIQSIEVQPLARRRVFIRYTPPVDPWNGISQETDDVLDLRIPLAAPDVWPCTIIDRLTGSAEATLESMVSGRSISITSELRNATIREILAHYARSAQGGRLEMEPRLRKFRFVKD